MTSNELHAQLEVYLGLRQALGYERSSSETKLLRQLVDFIGAQAPTGPIASQLVLDWLDTRFPKSSPPQNARRLSVVRQFLVHLGAVIPGTEIPELRLFARYPRPKPFLFSSEEVEALLRSATRSCPEGSFLPVTFKTILGLLASTGLRSGEALALDTVDVVLDAEPGHLCIREAKFHKSRLLPLHPSTVIHLTAYARQRSAVGTRSPAFFIADDGDRLRYETLCALFQRLLRHLGLTAREGSSRPTLHSLRHTFAVTRLIRWHQEGADVRTRLAHLATYLGHVDVRSTYWYLTATPELLSVASKQFAAPDDKEVGDE